MVGSFGDVVFEFNRNILYCKSTTSGRKIKKWDNLIGTFCIVNIGVDSGKDTIFSI